MILTNEQIEEIRKRAEAASPGPWEMTSVKGDAIRHISPDSRLVLNSYGAWAVGPQVGQVYRADLDQEFINKARSDIPALIETVEELQKQLEPKTMAEVTFIENEKLDSRAQYVLNLEKQLAEAREEIRKLKDPYGRGEVSKAVDF